MATLMSSVRGHVQSLSGIGHAIGGGNQRISPEKMKAFATVGDSLDKALEAVLAYTQARTDTRSPTVAQFNKTLGLVTASIARAAGKGVDGRYLSKSEESGLAKTMKAVALSTRDFGKVSVSSVVGYA